MAIRKGFTLIEALVGMAVLGIAMLGLAQLFIVSLRNNARAGEIGRAAFLAQQSIDYLRTLTAEELNSFPSPTRNEKTDETLDLNADGTPDFRRVIQVEPSGLSYGVKVLVFSSRQVGRPVEDLVAAPWSNGVRAVVNTKISR